MVNYKNASVYKLCCKDPTIKDVYVGSTCNFRTRKNDHKKRCTNSKHKNYNIYVYQFIRETGGWDNWNMVLVEKVNCEDKQTLNKIEREWLEKLQATLNSNIPTRTKKEWRETNKENIKKRMKKWRENNKKKIKEYDKKYKENNKEKIKKCKKKYRQINTTCYCGTEIKLNNICRHKKTKKHRNLIAKIKKSLHIELLKLF